MTVAGTEFRTLEFVEPIPGFDDESSFRLSAIDPDGLLLSMRSEQHHELRFVVTPATCFFGDYAPELAPVVIEALGADGASDVELLLILTIGAGLADATANLRAPVVVCAGTGRAMQVVLDDESLSLRRRLLG